MRAWQARFPAFLAAIERAEAEVHRDCVRDILNVRGMDRPKWKAWYLTHKAPDEWAAKERIEHSGPGGGAIITAALTADEIKKMDAHTIVATVKELAKT